MSKPEADEQPDLQMAALDMREVVTNYWAKVEAGVIRHPHDAARIDNELPHLLEVLRIYLLEP